MKIAGYERGEFRYGVNGVRALIRATGKTPLQMIGRGFDPSDFEAGVHLVWGGLLWSNNRLVPDTVGEWFDADPGAYREAVASATRSLTETFERFVPSAEEPEGDEEEKERKN